MGTDRVWVGGDGFILASADGETWAVVSDQSLDDIDVLDATTVYGVAPDGVVVSDDGGRTWEVVPGTEGAVAACFATRAEGWVTDGRTLRRTRDGGATWTELAGEPTKHAGGTLWTGRWVDVACPGGDVLWARISYGRGAGTEAWDVYRSDDGGGSWHLVAGKSQGRFRAGVSGPWDVVDADTVLLAGWGAVYLTFEGTHDGGQTWEGWLYHPETYTALEPGSWEVTPLFGWPTDLSFGDPEHGWVINGSSSAGLWRLMRTVDGGRTWEPFSVNADPAATEPVVRLPAAEPTVEATETEPTGETPASEPVAQGTTSQQVRLALPTRAELRDRLVRELNDGRQTVEQVLNGLVGLSYRKDEVPWLAADLDGNGDVEYVLARAVQDGEGRWDTGAALLVVYRQGESWQVDCSEPMDPRVERELMAPHLHAVADLTGSGTLQIVWYRPELIATGPQPHFVFITAWEPGRFTHLPGTMALSNAWLALDGADVVLTGINRNNTYLPVMERTDRYRFVDGEFRLVDRRFTRHPEDGYARLWDGLVAEAVGRMEDALTAYREATDPDRPAHSGQIGRYNNWPREMTPDEVERFGEALRAFARFRLGILLLGEGRGEEAAAALSSDGPYAGLLDAARSATDRAAACRAAADWATANAAFLGALNLGVGTDPWTADILCGHIDIDDHGLWEQWH